MKEKRNYMVAMTREEHEEAHSILEKHFKTEVGNGETLKAWELFKEDYVNQTTGNLDKEAIIKEAREYVQIHTETKDDTKGWSTVLYDIEPLLAILDKGSDK